MTPDWRPPYAYVPGQTPRHPEGFFDPIRADGALSWTLGLAFLRDGYLWEAHEVLEPVWMAHPPNSAERALVQGLIQLANAALKTRMDRPRAAERLMTLADGHLAEGLRRGKGAVLGLDAAAVSILRGELAQGN